MSCLDDSDDHLRWLAPTDINLDYMGITYLDCVTRLLWQMVDTIKHYKSYRTVIPLC